MAQILPTDWDLSRSQGASARSAQTLGVFERALPDAITVFHGVHWSRNGSGLATIGDIDFVVLAPDGRLLLVEQKSGFLGETDEGLVKRYRGTSRRIRIDVDRTISELTSRLSVLAHGEPLIIQYLLYCPDYEVKNRATAGLAPDQIVDSTQREQLCQRIQYLLGDADQKPRIDLARRLHRFFANELELVPDASALVGRAQALITRMSEGLATWARRIEFSPMRMRVQATAGSGKTQLALALLDDASQQAKRALYVCYNRPLADHIRLAAPDDALVFNYHQLCQHRLRKAGQDIEFQGDGAFAALEAAAQALEPETDDLVDILIIDEGQDFMASWRDDLSGLVHPDETRTAIWWMEDPMQNLYDREPAAPTDWPLLRAQVNYRSPRAIVNYLNRVLKLEEPVIGSGPVQGAEPQLLVYDDADGLVAQTKQAVTLALRAGFRREDIVLVSYAGRNRSQLHSMESIGPHKLRQFAGKYDLFGNPQFSDGDLILETVFRFKGQAAPCVILTEVAFDTLDERATRKLLVGLTRASLHLIVVCERGCDQYLA